jgi:hypothetical protein
MAFWGKRRLSVLMPCSQFRLLQQTMAELPADASEFLPLVLSACKLVDLLLVLQTEEFQV